jgi:hypothetical protein
VREALAVVVNPHPETLSLQRRGSAGRHGWHQRDADRYADPARTDRLLGVREENLERLRQSLLVGLCGREVSLSASATTGGGFAEAASSISMSPR